MRSIHRLLTVVLVLAGTLTSTGAYGQGGATGAISGAVVDTSGGSVAEAEVQVLDTRTESLVRKVSTNADGSFVVPLLPPGIYAVVVNKSGFAQAKASGIEVRVAQTTKVTISLKPGAVTEKVEISAEITSSGNDQCRYRSVAGHGNRAGIAAGHAELSAVADAFQRCAERAECLGAAGTWQRPRHRERTARGQQQLPDRGNQRNGLQRGPGHLRSFAKSRCDPGIQGANIALRRQPGAQRRRQRQRHPQIRHARAPRRWV